MSYRHSRPEYEVRVDGIPLAGAGFVIQAAVAYSPDLTDVERDHLAPKARLELLLAIEGEKARARRLGLQATRVNVVGDEHLYRMLTMPARMSPPAPARTERPRGAVVQRSYRHAPEMQL